MHHVNNNAKVVAFHRWQNGGPGDDVIVVANFSNNTFANYRIGLPRSGTWKLRLNSDWSGYSPDYANYPSFDTNGDAIAYDGLAYSGLVSIAPYTALIYSQTPPSMFDLNGDWFVDGADLGMVLGMWGQPGAADFNGDGIVDGADLGSLLGAWGAVQ
jgi:1,4-alpha-glucan branching enzyme